MSAVIDGQQDPSWWQHAWQEHRAWVLSLAMLAVSFIDDCTNRDDTSTNKLEYGCCL